MCNVGSVEKEFSFVCLIQQESLIIQVGDDLASIVFRTTVGGLESEVWTEIREGVVALRRAHGAKR